MAVFCPSSFLYTPPVLHDRDSKDLLAVFKVQNRMCVVTWPAQARVLNLPQIASLGLVIKRIFMKLFLNFLVFNYLELRRNN